MSRRSEAIHDKAFINCQYSVATFSTSERRKRPRGDRQVCSTSCSVEELWVWLCSCLGQNKQTGTVYVYVCACAGITYYLFNAAKMLLLFNCLCISLSQPCTTCRKSTDISLSLKKTFEVAILRELFPMSKIDIFVQVLQSDGGIVRPP